MTSRVRRSRKVCDRSGKDRGLALGEVLHDRFGRRLAERPLQVRIYTVQFLIALQPGLVPKAAGCGPFSMPPQRAQRTANMAGQALGGGPCKKGLLNRFPNAPRLRCIIRFIPWVDG